MWCSLACEVDYELRQHARVVVDSAILCAKRPARLREWRARWFDEVPPESHVVPAERGDRDHEQDSLEYQCAPSRSESARLRMMNSLGAEAEVRDSRMMNRLGGQK